MSLKLRLVKTCGQIASVRERKESRMAPGDGFGAHQDGEIRKECRKMKIVKSLSECPSFKSCYFKIQLIVNFDLVLSVGPGWNILAFSLSPLRI